MSIIFTILDDFWYNVLMVIIVTLIAAFLIVFVIRKHTGVMHLAMLAGLGIYTMFHEIITNFISQTAGDIDSEFVNMIIYAILVVGFPLLLFLKSSRGGLSGILRLVEAAMTAIVVAVLLAEPLSFFFSFDSIATEMHNLIVQIEPPVLLASIIVAYLDILLSRRL